MLRASIPVALIGLLLYGSSAVAQDNSSLPLQYGATTLEGDGDSCPPDGQTSAARDEISGDVRAHLQNQILPVLRGYGSCGCGGPGWTQIAYLDMTDPTQQCPSNWTLISTPKRSCGRTNDGECDSATFSSDGVQYSQVCGRIIGYQKDTTDAFWTYNSELTPLDGPYVDGVSVTRGSPREHIWTFAAGLDELGTGTVVSDYCPCNTAIDVSGIIVPPYVGNDYFCESGTEMTNGTHTGIVYTDDPLWDGQGCGPTTNCCTFNNPPWFCKELPQVTADDIEIRICGNWIIASEDTYVELIDIYIQ